LLIAFVLASCNQGGTDLSPVQFPQTPNVMASEIEGSSAVIVDSEGSESETVEYVEYKDITFNISLLKMPEGWSGSTIHIENPATIQSLSFSPNGDLYIDIADEYSKSWHLLYDFNTNEVCEYSDEIRYAPKADDQYFCDRKDNQIIISDKVTGAMLATVGPFPGYGFTSEGEEGPVDLAPVGGGFINDTVFYYYVNHQPPLATADHPGIGFLSLDGTIDLFYESLEGEFILIKAGDSTLLSERIGIDENIPGEALYKVTDDFQLMPTNLPNTHFLGLSGNGKYVLTVAYQENQGVGTATFSVFDYKSEEKISSYIGSCSTPFWIGYEMGVSDDGNSIAYISNWRDSEFTVYTYIK